jgi:integrase
MAKPLTTRSVEAAKADPDKRRRELPDGAQTGLYLVVHPTGRKTWAVRYRFRGKPQKLTLPPPDPGQPERQATLLEAREAAQAVLRAIANGQNPAAEKRSEQEVASEAAALAERDLFRVQAQRYIDGRLKPRIRSWPEVERLFRLHVSPKWGERRVQDLAKRDVLELLEALVESGTPILANRIFANLRALFRWLVEKDVLTASPMTGLRMPAPETSRDRVLSDDELPLIWRAAETLGAPFDNFVKLLILSAARRNEAAEAQWSEFDLAEKAWRLPAARTKNKRPHTLPLPAATLALLAKVPKIDKCPYLFSGTGKTAISGFAKLKQRLDDAILKQQRRLAEEAGRDPEKVEPLAAWGLHDLRRTAASGMARLGIAPHVIEGALNHASGQVSGLAAVYNRYSYDAERANAFGLWAEHVARVVEGKAKPTANVVPLRRRKKRANA